MSNTPAELSLVERWPRAAASGPVAGTWQTQSRFDVASVDALVDALLDGYLSGRGVYELAAEFGIERQTVSAHLNRRGAPT